MATSQQTQKITGELTFLRVYPSGWGIGEVNTAEGKVKVDGNALNGLKKQSTYEFCGKAVEHEKYGKSFKVSVVNVFVPDSEQAIVKYLTKNYSGIGEKTAKKFVEKYLGQGDSLDDLRDLILSNPFALDFSNVTKRKTASKDKGGLKGAIYRQFATKLGGIDTSDAVFRALAGYYEKKCAQFSDPIAHAWNEFIQNPYAPIRNLAGYGFQRADLLGRKLQFPLDAPARIAALATFAIDEGCNTNGHSFLTLEDFQEKIAALDKQVNPLHAIAAATEFGEPIVVAEGRYYIKKYYLAEKFLASSFANRLGNKGTALFDGDVEGVIEAIGDASKAIGLQLDPSQFDAVKGMLTSDETVHTLTAGPGCGKTALMELLVHILLFDTNIGFAAPTGKAAKVLNSRVSKLGVKATTIHSMLGTGEGGGFMYHQDNHLPFDLLVIDETSMVDLALMNSLVSAVREDCHIIFLGDPKQLPSVGPGNCLSDILQLPFDHHSLNKTHRNDGGILDVIRLAGAGRADFTLKRPDVDFHSGLPEATLENVQELLGRFDCELKAVDGDFAAVGLLVARRKGDANNPGWNTTYLNGVMREIYNGSSEKIPGTIYRVNDRIIIRKNLALAQPDDEDGFPGATQSVVNGDTGFIRDYELKETDSEDGSIGTLKMMKLELDDGRELYYPAGALESMGHAYAMTVHAAQGSEYKRVISICVNGAPNFIHRGILFTAWSRAQDKLTVIGDPQAIEAILKRDRPARNSHLITQTVNTPYFKREKPVWNC